MYSCFATPNYAWCIFDRQQWPSGKAWEVWRSMEGQKKQNEVAQVWTGLLSGEQWKKWNNTCHCFFFRGWYTTPLNRNIAPAWNAIWSNQPTRMRWARDFLDVAQVHLVILKQDGKSLFLEWDCLRIKASNCKKREWNDGESCFLSSMSY